MVLLVDTVTNLRITDSEALPSPADLCGDIARTTQQKMLVAKSRNEMHSLIHGKTSVFWPLWALVPFTI